MGAHPYWYYVPYKDDINAALQELRQREFNAGRYNPAVPFIRFPIDPSKPGPGAKHRSINDAQRAADADGTRSILDIEQITDEPDFAAASPMPQEHLERYFSTKQPTHDQIESTPDFFEDLERGQAIYIVVYKDNRPDEIYFAGYSFD